MGARVAAREEGARRMGAARRGAGRGAVRSSGEGRGCGPLGLWSMRDLGFCRSLSAVGVASGPA
jgi:hypothetical protein